jgi:hypothetical protein
MKKKLMIDITIVYAQAEKNFFLSRDTRHL